MRLLIDELDGLKRDLQFTDRTECDDAEQALCESNCAFLWDHEAQIMATTDIPLDVILYSLYYWQHRLLSRMAALSQYDAGAEQQQFQLIEEIESRLGAVDFALLKQIESDSNLEE